MSEKRWTSGRWVASHFFKDPPSHPQWSIWASDNKEGGEYVAQTVGVNQTENQRMANAQLIAAAPDLYDALESAFNWGFSLGDCQQVHYYEELISKTKAALAKARGEA